MKGHTPVNKMPAKGHASGDMRSYNPVNPHTPTNGPPAQANMVPKMSGPVKSGKGDPTSGVK